MKKRWAIDAEINMCANKHMLIYVDAKTKRLATMKAEKQLKGKKESGEIFFYMIESIKEVPSLPESPSWITE